MSINIANALSARLPVPPLPDLMLEPLVRSALLEDLGRAGDLTTDAIVPADAQAELRLVARQEGVLAGLDMARLAFRALDAQSRFEPVLRDGSELAPGQEIARIHGSARAILTAERVALNYLCHLSGVATATASIARAIADTGARVTCTRKTMPGLRALQKYAVRVGGGSNHRFGLDDAVLIKDNHIALAGGVAEALARRARAWATWCRSSWRWTRWSSWRWRCPWAWKWCCWTTWTWTRCARPSPWRAGAR